MSALARYVAWVPREERPARLPIPMLRPAGPAWLAWRSHRAAYRTVAVLVFLAAVWAVWQHHQLIAGVHRYAEACREAPHSCSVSDSDSSAQPPPPVPGVVHTLFDHAPSVLRYLPLAVGALLGGPLFAQDVEAGRHRLAWTQSVGRREWVAAKLSVATLVTLVAAVVLTVPVTWWWYSSWRGHHSAGRTGYAWRSVTWWNDWSFFTYTGPVGVAHLLLALMIGAATGMLVRRTLPAVAVSAGLCEGVMFGLDRLRPHLVSPYIRRGTGMHYPDLIPDAWYLGGGWVRNDGTLTTADPCGRVPTTDYRACLSRHHITGLYSRDLRPSQFVPLQLIETGICLAAAVALAALCLWHVRRVSTR